MEGMEVIEMEAAIMREELDRNPRGCEGLRL